MPARNAKDIVAPWTHWFLYGESGSGKTKSASTFSRPCFLVPYNEQSITTLRGMDVPYYEVTGAGEIGKETAVVDGSGSLMSVLLELETLYYQDIDAFPYETIVIESITHYSDLVMEEMTRGGKVFMDQGKWGSFLAHFRNIQSRLRKMQVHAVFTALSKVDKADDDTIIGGPHIQGQVAAKLPSACDVIGYCEEVRSGKDSVYRMHLRKYKHFPARSRFRDVPATIDNFNFTNIEKFLQ
jgi:hypothetical protein